MYLFVCLFVMVVYAVFNLILIFYSILIKKIIILYYFNLIEKKKKKKVQIHYDNDNLGQNVKLSLKKIY